jgi:sporulation protein YlmC with PRC-barrel domain
MMTKERPCSFRLLLMGLLGLTCLHFFLISAMAEDVKEGKTGNPLRVEKADTHPMVRASKLIDQAVYNEQSEEIGEIDDLIISRNGKIKKVILSVGEFVGVGERLVAIPFRSVKRDGTGHVVYNVGREQLRDYPRFDYRKEGLYGEPYYPSPLFSTGYSPYASLPPRMRCRGESIPWAWEYYPERLRVSALLDRGVLNNTGQEVAELSELMISPEGRVEQIILDAGGFLRIDEKLVAVPFKPLKITDLGIVYNITKEQLQKSPVFSYGGK